MPLFFLLSLRAERTPRLTFATFQMPLGAGHFIGVNSGGGGLSNALVLSTTKNILLDPPFYMSTAFEQGNGAAVEVQGPLVGGLLGYRTFVAGGSGRFNGNVGGRFFSFDNTNYTYALGGQLVLSPVGQFDRWDTRYLYTPVPLAMSLYVGGRYDQRAQERFPAVNTSLLFRWEIVVATLEGYDKRELEFGSWQLAYNLTVGVSHTHSPVSYGPWTRPLHHGTAA